MAADPETPDEEAGSGVDPAGSRPGAISIGLMTGGAAAVGDRACAEDRSQRVGTPATLPSSYAGLPAPATVPGGIGIGMMTGGAAASGTDAKAVDSSTQLLDAPPELLAAVRTLREHLSVLTRTAEIAELDDQLAGAEEEMTETAQVSRDRLHWLRDRLTLGATAAAGLASAAAVVQTIVRLVG
jgi:hypothetical protein